MTDEQKYLFDLQGFVLVEEVLTHDECDMAIEKIKQRMRPMEKTPDGYDANGTWHSAGKLLEAGQPFINLIDHPKLVSVLENIISPSLRIEGAYSFVRSKGCPQFEMHGGYRGGNVNFRYYVHGNNIHTGLTVISFALQDVDEDAGGFACIPGSHKSSFGVPGDSRQRLYDMDGGLVRNVPSPRGSAVIFTECLAHGANVWQQDEPRYGLFYKYNDRSAIYHRQDIRLPSQEAFDQMTDNQKCFFNTAWEAFGNTESGRNDVPEYGVVE
jgi:hypothetical protein